VGAEGGGIVVKGAPRKSGSGAAYDRNLLARARGARFERCPAYSLAHLPAHISDTEAPKKKAAGACGRQRLEGGISKEEEEKPRNPIIQERGATAIMLSNRVHQLCGTRAILN
jgi:hypothetical protein